MKNILSPLFLLLLFSTLLSAQTTPVPDANFEAFLIAQGVLKAYTRPEEVDAARLEVADKALEAAIERFNKQFED